MVRIRGAPMRIGFGQMDIDLEWDISNGYAHTSLLPHARDLAGQADQLLYASG